LTDATADPLDAIRWLAPETIRAIHDAVLEPDNLRGEDGARPIESALARVEQRAHYGDLVPDVLTIGVAYLATIAKAHAFVDGNKRTATVAMSVFLERHGYQLAEDTDPEWLADQVEAVAGDRLDETGLHRELAPYFVETND